MSQNRISDNGYIVPGLNVQWPWSELLVSGKKTIETRHYPLPEKYRNRYLALIETPGKAGAFSARITALIKFSGSFLYGSRSEWLADRTRHRVSPNDEVYGFTLKTAKWGWTVEEVIPLKTFAPPPRRRGIRFTKECNVPDPRPKSVCEL